MGVYIEGMEMPTSCGDCPFRMCFGYDDEIDCTLIKGAFMAYPDSHERRHKDCPLVEVKAPHGRLIDADALAMKWIFGQPEKREIQEAPTIIKAEGKDDG